MEETWRKVPGFSAYDVSDYGRVRSYYFRKGTIVELSETPQRILKPAIVSNGYLSVVMKGDNGVNKTVFIHHAVAWAFIGENKENNMILHGDGNKINNSPKNIRYGTRQDNYRDSEKHGTGILLSGENHWFSKFSDNDIVSMREKRAAGAGTDELAKEYKTTRKEVSRIVSGRRWKSVGGPLTKRFTNNKKSFEQGCLLG